MHISLLAEKASRKIANLEIEVVSGSLSVISKEKSAFKYCKISGWQKALKATHHFEFFTPTSHKQYSIPWTQISWDSYNYAICPSNNPALVIL